MINILKIVNKYKFPIAITLLALFIFILATYFIYVYIYSRKDKVEGYNHTSDNVNLIMFHVNWCPYCKTALPVWAKITQNYNGTRVNGKKLSVISLDSTDENSTSSYFENKTIDTILNQFKKNGSKFSIDGYPTIVLADENNNILAEFNQSTNYDNLEEFINKNV